MAGVKGQRSGGKNAKTLQQHALDGTTPHYTGQRSPEPRDGAPPKPGGLDPVASAEWDRMIGDLLSMKAVSVVDGGVLYEYCQLYGLAERLQRTVDALPEIVTVSAGDAKLRPEVRELRQLRIALRQYLGEFGLTPASRGRVRLPEAPKESDPFAEFEQPVH